MAWVLLVLAIAAEVVGTFALKTLDVGPAYALWAGLGTVGAAVGGWLIFSERMNLLTISGIAIVIIGVVAITLGESRA
jgi:multidrug transporter EmrE-like cation transporter